MSVVVLEDPIFGIDRTSGFPVVVIAIADGFSLLVIEDDGQLRVREPIDIKTDMRYDLKEQKWYDVSVAAAKVEGDG